MEDHIEVNRFSFRNQSVFRIKANGCGEDGNQIRTHTKLGLTWVNAKECFGFLFAELQRVEDRVKQRNVDATSLVNIPPIIRSKDKRETSFLYLYHK